MKVEDWLGADNTLGIKIWHTKYQQNDETFDEWLDRVSGGNKAMRKLIVEKKALFGGRILSNRGLKNGSLSNCYCLKVEDSISSIYKTAGDMAQTYKAGGGVGLDLGSLAPAGAKVNNPAKTSSGAVSFADLFSLTTGLIGQAGRRGALMLSLPCDHPDIDKFITLKTDVEKATSANLSIRVSDDFMRAVEKGDLWETSFTRKETGETISKTYNTRELFKQFCDANYDYGEPGMIFWGNIEKNNMLNTYPEFEFAGLNPCSEVPLPEGGACLLGSLNLSAYVTNDEQFDFNSFSKDVCTFASAMDDVQEEGIELHPLELQKETARTWRQLGMGIMGLGDMLVKMNIPYGSQESIELCNKIGTVLANNAITTSVQRGVKFGSFKHFDPAKTTSSEFWKAHRTNNACPAMRNSQLLAIAPTGTISTMIGVSGGIEPIYALEFNRTTKSLEGKETIYKVIPKVVAQAREEGKFNGLVCAKDVPYEQRIAMQAVWQKHIDGSISSTINLPNDFPKEKVGEIYLSAWRAGLKGITVYRDGCKRAGILTEEKKTVTPVNDDELIGRKKKIVTGCGNQHISLFSTTDGRPQEIFISRGGSGGCTNTLNGLGRLISLAMRHDIPVEEIIDQLESCGTCPSYASRRVSKGDVSAGTCCPSAIAKVLRELTSNNAPKEEVRDKCPECGAKLIHENGCVSCSCGFSRCG